MYEMYDQHLSSQACFKNSAGLVGSDFAARGEMERWKLRLKVDDDVSS